MSVMVAPKLVPGVSLDASRMWRAFHIVMTTRPLIQQYLGNWAKMNAFQLTKVHLNGAKAFARDPVGASNKISSVPISSYMSQWTLILPAKGKLVVLLCRSRFLVVAVTVLPFSEAWSKVKHHTAQATSLLSNPRPRGAPLSMNRTSSACIHSCHWVFARKEDSLVCRNNLAIRNSSLKKT